MQRLHYSRDATAKQLLHLGVIFNFEFVVLLEGVVLRSFGPLVENFGTSPFKAVMDLLPKAFLGAADICVPEVLSGAFEVAGP